ncbi:hypothetical protein [Actinophytocola algeriensis]|uniref:Tetratricopeptide repeat protein n=1 Tax=Actinophytocola algeriensis TaxID=1768010 RepID=A0A7W7VD16_9PSEU|nr:hypothetical protein [Actinophytocola algeriensis]MBB4905667.1 hypothetical protein [Actinophytocola algeriensis]MBE1472648.1 hypothetical protein [Actinophytocola algeriensis]
MTRTAPQAWPGSWCGTARTTLEIRLSRIAALDAAQRHDEALDLAEHLAADAEHVLGPDHPTTSDARFAVADIAARRA